jgi:hypothetical protein
MKCNETLSKWCKNKHGASKIIDTLETYHQACTYRDLGPDGRMGGWLTYDFSLCKDEDFPVAGPS